MAIITLVKEGFARLKDGTPIKTDRVDGKVIDWWLGGFHIDSPALGKVTVPYTAIVLLQYEEGDKRPCQVLRR